MNRTYDMMSRRTLYMNMASSITIIILLYNFPFYAYSVSFTLSSHVIAGSCRNSCDSWKIAASGENVYVAWLDYQGSAVDEVMFARSTDHGATFSSAVSLSNTPNHRTFEPDMAIDGNNVYVVWADYSGTGERGDIWFTYSVDGGATFSRKINLSTNWEASLFPTVAVYGSHVYVAWLDWVPDERSLEPYSVKFIKSEDGGATFSERARTLDSFRWIEGNRLGPQMEVAGSDIVLVWEADDWSVLNNGSRVCCSAEIFYTMSSDSGMNWLSEPINLSNTWLCERNPDPYGPLFMCAAESRYPSLALSGGNIYVSWGDSIFVDPATSRDQIYHILFAKIGSDGERRIIDLGPGLYYWRSQIAVSGTSAVLTWHDSSTRSDLSTNANVLAKRIDITSYNIADIFSLFAPGSSSPTVIAESSNFFLSWRGPGDLARFPHYYLAASEDGGVTYGNIVDVSAFDTLLRYPQVGQQLAATPEYVYLLSNEGLASPKQLFVSTARISQSDETLDKGFAANLTLSEADSVMNSK